MRLRGYAFHVVRSASNSTYSTIMNPAIPAILACCPIADLARLPSLSLINDTSLYRRN